MLCRNCTPALLLACALLVLAWPRCTPCTLSVNAHHSHPKPHPPPHLFTDHAGEFLGSLVQIEEGLRKLNINEEVRQQCC
jgi:hypothetical protein